MSTTRETLLRYAADQAMARAARRGEDVVDPAYVQGFADGMEAMKEAAKAMWRAVDELSDIATRALSASTAPVILTGADLTDPTPTIGPRISWDGLTPGETATNIADEFTDVAPARVDATVRMLGLDRTAHVRMVLSVEAAAMVRRELRSRGYTVDDGSEG